MEGVLLIKIHYL